MESKFTPIDIQYQLKKRGITQKQIAKEQRVSEMSVSDVINFRIVSKRLMFAVAEKIEERPEEVFHWYFVAKLSPRALRAA